MHDRIDRRPGHRLRRWWLDIVARHGRNILVLGVLGVAFYVASWAIAGALWAGYSPVNQAISEIFAIGAPLPGRILVTTSLMASGLVSLAFAWALHAAFPRTGRRAVDLAGPVLGTGSGLFTFAAAFVPCTFGCPGAGATLIDTLHTVVAGTGYLCLILAPAAFALRIRHAWPRLAVASLAVSVAALTGFAIHTLGLADDVRGGLQRTFNTLADLWYVGAAAVAYPRMEPERAATGDDRVGGGTPQSASG